MLLMRWHQLSRHRSIGRNLTVQSVLRGYYAALVVIRGIGSRREIAEDTPQRTAPAASRPMEKQAWLIIERLENWEADQAAGFTMFGLSARYKKLASRIETRDFVFCYVSSGISAFSDIRLVQAAGIKPLRRSTDYDAAFDFYISTAPLIVLQRPRWVSLKSVVSDLDLTKNREEWRQMFRTSLRLLSAHDGELLKARCPASAPMRQI